MTVLGPRLLAGAALVAALGVACTGCTGNDGTASAVEGISIERTTTTTIPPAPKLTTTSLVAVELLPPAQLSRPAPPPPRSWEGQNYDFGLVERLEQQDGDWVVLFDRQQISDEHGSRSGPTLTEEPVLIGDIGEIRILNSSRQARSFGVRSDAQVLRLSASWNCAQPMPVWDHLTVEELATTGVGADVRDALTFDSDGQVSQIRLSRGC